MTHDAASRAAEAIADLLAGSLDDCRRAVAKADIGRANLALTLTADRLRRIRRDLREEVTAKAEPDLGDPPQE
ncbi:hypothetical protein [Roseomonas indoligenes]|uniref:Uncharacterized protein n=1 Tax=Roseomonas indoligenes TaxID=2820811 RepID=A0A940N4F5_9PROT|nr:hypothetical protein [Pararoseomonas indoligenes]MBP0495781.1 hypothetical protein [Pararoseomonas indoligenes]